MSGPPSSMTVMSRRRGRNPSCAAVRMPGEREMRTGYDLHGRYIEMVGVLLPDGTWLVYHAMTPPSKKTLREIENARRRGY